MKKTYLLFLLGISLVAVSCIKSHDNTGSGESAPLIFAPVLVTSDVVSVTSDGALTGGRISDSSGAAITERGICISTAHNPTIDNTKVPPLTNTANFVVQLDSLSEHVTYYIRAYAINSAGVGYGNELSFTPAVTLGETYQGGTVFFLDGRAEHGLVAGDLDESASWGCAGADITGADSSAVGYGVFNTYDIVAECTTADIAAKLAFDYGTGIDTAWFLPAKNELLQLYNQRRFVGGMTTNGTYWSSTEYNADSAWAVDFSSGQAVIKDKQDQARVRAIKAF